jgi:glucosyl-3-phosphoglycerate synthase
MAAEGIRLDTGLFDALLSAYLRKAEDTIRFYSADAAINGLTFDRHQEELAVSTFVRGIRTAAREYMADPLGGPLIPNWNRVESAMPDFLEEFREAVEADNR